MDAINTVTTSMLELNPKYVANKTEEVNSFMKQTCLNNCSENGVCLETGLLLLLFFHDHSIMSEVLCIKLKMLPRSWPSQSCHKLSRSMESVTPNIFSDEN